MKTKNEKRIKSVNFVKLEASDMKLIKGGEAVGKAAKPSCPAVKCSPCNPGSCITLVTPPDQSRQ